MRVITGGGRVLEAARAIADAHPGEIDGVVALVLADKEKSVMDAVAKEEAEKIAAGQEEDMRRAAEKRVVDPEWVARKRKEMQREFELDGTLARIEEEAKQKALAQLRAQELARLRKEAEAAANELESIAKLREVAVAESQAASDGVHEGSPLSDATSLLMRHMGFPGQSIAYQTRANGKIVTVRRSLTPDS